MNEKDIITLASDVYGVGTWKGGILERLKEFTYKVEQTVRQQMMDEGYRQCASGQRSSQFCGQLENSVKKEREACALLCENARWSLGDPVIVGGEWYESGYNACTNLAKAIRNRGTE